MEYVGSSLAVLMTRIPVFLTWLAGIVLAIIFWKKHPRVSLLITIGLGLMLVNSVVGTLVSVWMPFALQERGMSIMQIGSLLSVWGVASSLINAAIWVLLLVAIFGWRKSQEMPA
jgi:hypothetical protein